jgi:3-deoxy-D-manno-octulosonic-acid transferase
MGGQNPIEPAALGKAIVFGPNMQNFADITHNFITENGAIQVQNPESLETAIASLLADEGRRTEMGHNAQRVVRKNLGAIDRTVDMILEKLDPRGVYITPEI